MVQRLKGELSPSDDEGKRDQPNFVDDERTDERVQVSSRDLYETLRSLCNLRGMKRELTAIVIRARRSHFRYGVTGGRNGKKSAGEVGRGVL